MATYDLKYPGAAIDAILDTAYDLQNAGYIFRGLASEYSNTPTERSWVLAGEGETGHGFTSPVPKGYIGVCVFNGTSWTGKLLKCVSIDSTPTNGSTNVVSSGGAYASISQLATTVNEALDNLTFSDATPSAFLGEYIKEKVSTTAGGIERILTFFNILAATAEKAGLLSAADKQKLDAILGNLRSLKIDDTTAYADLGTKIVESIKATIGGTEETISTFQILAATASKAGLLSAADKAKLDALWSSGYQFAGIATPSTTPVNTTSKIFYIATEAGTYFNAVTVTQGINILSWNGTSWSAVQVVGIDDEPTAGSENLIKSGGVTNVIGNASASLVEEASSLIYTEVIKNLGIKQGQNFSIKVSGTHSGDRILLRANNTSGYNIQDFCEIDKLYYKTAEIDIDSIFVYHNGNIDITLYVNTNIQYTVEKNKDDIVILKEDVTPIPELNKEVFGKNTFTVDATAPNPAYVTTEFFVKKGDIFTIRLEALTALSAIVMAADASDNAIGGRILDGAMTQGQVIESTITATSNVYKMRFSFSVRGILKVITTNQTLRHDEDVKYDNIDSRVNLIEDVIEGTESYDAIDEQNYDMVENLEISTIHGDAYSYVRFKIINTHDVPLKFFLYYRNTHLRSVLLTAEGIMVEDRSVRDVTFVIPEDFVSVLYQGREVNRLTVQTITTLNPVLNNNISEIAISSNVLDISKLTANKFLRPDGTEGADNTYSYTDYIPVKEGQVIVVSNDVAITSGTETQDVRPLVIRFVAAYDYLKNIIESKGTDVAGYSYTVPFGVHYIRITAKTDVINVQGSRINNGGVILPYEPYWSGTRPTGVTENRENIKSLYDFPLTKLPTYIKNSLAYKPLCSLSKGYLCVTDDDGSIGLGTYTLPMVIQKQVPVTFCLWKTSEILRDGNEQYKNLLINAVNNHGCTVAQHGGLNWTDYNEKQLYDFFNEEKQYWDSLGLDVKAASIPSHFVNKTIEAVAGGYYGVVRCGYDGLNPDNSPNYEAIHTDYYACTPRTNIYCLPSVNVRSYDITKWRTIIDYVVDNKLLLNVYFHDFDFVETAEDYQARRELLEGFLDYAKEHITMVNCSDIPRLV